MRFCGHCGARLSDAPASPSSPSLRSLVSRQVADRLAAGGEIADEWRLVTTLFADISGYVALSERLDPETLVDATAPIVGLMTDVAERYEAHVAKFAGDALLCMFGAPVVHEDDADRALLAALAMMDELDALRPELPEVARDLTLHIGVNTGRVVAALFGVSDRIDYNVMGDAVNLAQRLESAAPGGSIYVGESTVKMTRERFAFERVGDLRVRGKAEPVPAWRLLGRAVSANAPARRDGSGNRDELFGRAVELAALDGVVAGALDGRGSVVAIGGEAGTGKSALCAHAAASARARGVRVASIRFASIGAAPYEELVPLLRELGGSEDPTLGALLGATAHPGIEPRAFAWRVAAALGALLDRAAGRAPLVLLVEDVHWASAEALEIVAEAVGVARRRPVAVLVTGRPEAAGALDRLAGRVPAARRLALTLGPLDEASVGRIARRILGGELTADSVRQVAARTGGNPYFAEETLRWGAEHRVLVERGGGWVLARDWTEAGIPPTVEGVVAARVDRLPADAAGVLQVAAVAGAQLTETLLERVLGDGVNVRAAVDALVAAGLLDRPGTATVAFHHALASEVVYERLLRRRRAEIHRAIADAIEPDAGPDNDALDALAHHRFLAGDAAAALPLLLRAGERARRLYANDAAARHFERAASVATGPERTDALIAVADLAQLRGDYERAAALYRETLAGGGLRALRGLTATLRKQGAYAEAIELLEKALAEQTDDEATLRLEHGWTLSVAGRYDEAIGALRAGIAAAERDGRRDAVTASLLLELARALTVERALDEALAHAQAARAIFDEIGDLAGVATGARVAAAALHRLGRLDEAGAALRDGLALAERTGAVEEQAACLINLGMVALDRGALDEAIEHDRRAIAEFERIGHGSGRAIGYGNLAEKLLRRGELAEAETWCRRALEHAGAIGHEPTVADATRTLALVALERGDRETARTLALDAAERYERMGVVAEARDAGEIARRAGDGTTPA